VAAKCGRENGAKDDGVFWMEMGDFVKNFDMIDICHRGSGLSDLKLRSVGSPLAPSTCRSSAVYRLGGVQACFRQGRGDALLTCLNGVRWAGMCSTFEEDGCIGPVKGCVMGCGSYYCCCQGPIALCCPKESTIETQRKQKCCPV
jgi:hypothetical protein